MFDRRKAKNYEAAMRRHQSDSLTLLSQPHLLLEYSGKSFGRDDEPDVGSADSDGDSEPPNADCAGLGPVSDGEQPKPPAKKNIGTLDPLVTQCGTLPQGSQVDDLHAPPQRMHARNIEGLYW